MLASSSRSAAPDSARLQSTGSPSEIDPVTSSSESSVVMAHDPGELAHGTLYTHSRGIRAGSVHQGRDFFVAEFQLDPQVEEELLVHLQLRTRRLVPPEEIDADEPFERGRPAVGHLGRNGLRPG